jgi:Fe-S cluster assembly iron-binding protein IscA
MTGLALTDEARAHLAEELGARVLRISFTTGCGGSGYRLTSADSPQDGDVTLVVDGVTVALDEMAAKNLAGAVIRRDHEEDGYVLDHPSAVSAVWCG